MGFLRRLFGGGGKKNHHHTPPPGKEKRSWSFVKQSTRDNKSNNNNGYDNFTDNLDPNRHAIAVAAATAAVAEAALAAAHAAAEVVRLTSGGGAATPSQVQLRLAEEIAAVKIQSAFRGYLARRALRALKALVKLQALVRGHIVRKQSADMLRRMQTLVRLQARARASRVHLSDNMPSFKSSLSHYPVPEEYEYPLRAYSTKFDGSSILKRCCSNSNFRDIELERARFGSSWLDSWMEQSAWSQTGNASKKNGHIDDEKSDKILEVDTWKPHMNSHNNSSSSFKAPQHYFAPDYSDNFLMAYESPSKRSSKALNTSFSSREVLPLGSPRFHKGKEVVMASRTAENSPQAFSASSRLSNGGRRGPFTPTKSECSWGFFNGYTSHPSYMANTESSRAKVRSQSAPRQRLEFERYGSTRRSFQNPWDARPNPSSASSQFN
ncbi:hypothetical protein HN51_009430 [Arachis hypogaea]|uniref:DUF4005 domain-containing protein n=1 Tax=Arachis hypogaea TaxID=3818 RepID=A0A445CZC7_ARAHY|nr:protein IQ-DOMAIN 14 [Arachis hypogaea]QHO43941.1 Protein IQ-DOMAIN [Arachis hypogaea]RYR56279.1 hypothetical protein Ahy_A05g022020 [Arachis hypogaea]